MAIQFPPDKEIYVEETAKNKGYQSASQYLLDLVERDEKSVDRAPGHREDWAWRAIERVSGSATGGLRADEAMEMTRTEETTICR